MCVGCGGGCGDPPPPRFATPQTTGVRPTVVGSAAGPDLIPDVLIRQQDGGLITYESVWAGLGPNGEPAAMVLPGTYGQHVTRAGRR